MAKVFTLEQVLNTISIPFRHDELTFHLVPFTSTQITQWNRAVQLEQKEGESGYQFAERTRDAQLEVVAAHFQRCLSKGDAERVTPGWIADQIPQSVLGDFVNFFIHGQRPAFAEAEGK